MLLGLAWKHPKYGYKHGWIWQCRAHAGKKQCAATSRNIFLSAKEAIKAMERHQIRKKHKTAYTCASKVNCTNECKHRWL